MAQGDGMQARCPYFIARVDFQDIPYIHCGERIQITFDECRNPEIGGLHFMNKMMRDRHYQTRCCQMDECTLRDIFEGRYDDDQL